MDKYSLFLGKKCKLEKRGFNGPFVLEGKVIDVTNEGIVFQTWQQTSFISWTEIIELLPFKEGEGQR